MVFAIDYLDDRTAFGATRQTAIFPTRYLFGHNSDKPSAWLRYALGIIVLLFCAYLFRQKNTAIEPFQESSYLLKEGIFNYSRNPIYLSMITVLIGLWLYLGSLTPVFVIPVFAWLIQELFIKEEERMLEATFGEEYREYKATVRRWI